MPSPASGLKLPSVGDELPTEVEEDSVLRGGGLGDSGAKEDETSGLKWFREYN